MSTHCQEQSARQIKENKDDADSDLRVYEIVARHLQVREDPTDEARIDNYILRRGQVIAINEVIELADIAVRKENARYITGPYLRLSDGSGWIFENKAVAAGTTLHAVCDRLPVIHGQTWVFYIHPCRTAFMRSHPDTGSSVLEPLYPLRRVECDAMLIHRDINWYRIKETQGWVAKQFVEELDDNIGDSDFAYVDKVTLIPEACICFGMFAFAALQPIAIRNGPTVEDNDQTERFIESGQICLATVMIHDALDPEYESITPKGNGPFLYLPKLGFVFEKHRHKQVMRQLTAIEGCWALKILCDLQAPCGPILNTALFPRRRFLLGDQQDSMLCSQGQLILCDACVLSPMTGDMFYRIKSNHGFWICVRRDEAFVQLQSEADQAMAAEARPELEWDLVEIKARATDNNRQEKWSEDFVRGIAAPIDDIFIHDTTSTPGRVVFSKSAARIHVSYDDKLVIVQVQGAVNVIFSSCSSKALASILYDPIQAIKKLEGGHTFPAAFHSSKQQSLLNVEQRVVQYEDQPIKGSVVRKQRYAEKESFHERRRAPDSSGVKRLAREFEKKFTVNGSNCTTLVDEGTISGPSRQGALHTLTPCDLTPSEFNTSKENKSIACDVNLVCGACYERFSNPGARRLHCFEEHSLFSCNFCVAVFSTKDALKSHRDRLDHW
jgi:hypothetical protein